MSVPTAGELAGRSESNRVLLERLISNTANIIRDQKKWFAEPARASPSPVTPEALHAYSQAPTAIEAMRAAAFSTAAMDPLGPSPSPGLPRRPPDRIIASPPPMHVMRAVSPPPGGRGTSPSRMSPVPMAAHAPPPPPPPPPGPPALGWGAPLSPPLSPELAPPSTARNVSPMRERAWDFAPPHHQRVLRRAHACATLARATERDTLARNMVRLLGFAVARKAARAKDGNATIFQLQEMLAVATADAELAQARIEAAEARAGRSITDGLVADAQDAANRRVVILQHEAEEARVTAAAALRTLEEARGELDASRREYEQLLQQRAGGDAKLMDIQLQYQEAMLGKSRMQQELAGVRAAEEQREKENAQLRDELAAERTRLESDLASVKINAAKALEAGLAEGRKDHETRMHRLHAELDALRAEISEAHALRTEHEAVKVRMSALKVEADGLRQGDFLLRDQLDARLRELEAVHQELKGARAESVRLNERLQMSEIKAIGSTSDLAMKDAHAEVLRHAQAQAQRLEEQLRERAAAAAALEVQLASNAALLLKAESELEGKSQRGRWLEEEGARKDRAIQDLNRQLAEVRAEKEMLLRESINDRAAAAAAEAQQAAAAEKAAMLQQQLEQTRAEAIDSRVQLTELRAQLASTLARLEGREDAIIVLKDELNRTRDQLAAAEHLLSARARTADVDGMAQRNVEEKQKLVDHLEGRIDDMQGALDAKDKALADAGAKLDDLMRAKNQAEAERDQLAREAQAKDDEIARLKKLLEDAQDKLAGLAPVEKELDLLRARIRELEGLNQDLKDEIARLHAELAELKKQLADRMREVEALGDELRRQREATQEAVRAAHDAARRLLEAEALLERQRTETAEAEARGDLQQRRYQAQVKMLQTKNRRLKQNIANVLQQRNMARRLMGYWTALAGHAGRKSRRSMELFVQEKDLLANAVTDLHRVIKEQAKKVGDLEAALKRQKAKAAALLLQHTNWRTLAACYWKLLCNTRRRRTKTAVLRPQGYSHSTRSALRAPLSSSAATLISPTSSYTHRPPAPPIVPQMHIMQPQQAAPPTAMVVRHRPRLTQPLLSVRFRQLARYMMRWQRWRIRRLARYKMDAMLQRNQVMIMHRCMQRLVRNTLHRLRTALESHDSVTLSQHSRTQRRLEAARRRTAQSMAAAMWRNLGHRYLNKWLRHWQDTRLRTMTTRMQKIEKLLVGKERPYDGPFTPPGMPRSYYTSSGPSVLPLVERDEAMARSEMQRHEAAGYAKLCRVGADLRHGGLAASLLEAELKNAFANADKEELMDRMYIDSLQHQGFMQLLQDALWESQLGWSRRARLASLLQVELDAAAGQSAVLAETVAGLQAERDSVAARSLHESRRGDLAEAELNALARERVTLAADNAALAKQLEATASHLTGMDALTAQTHREAATVDDLRRELATRDSHTAGLRNGIVETEARLASATAELTQLRNELADTRAQLEVRAREAMDASAGALHQQTMQRQELKSEFAKMEHYGATLQEENERLKHIVRSELAGMQAEGDLASHVQAEGLLRLQLDRDELARRLELAFLMMEHMPGLPAQKGGMMSPPKRHEPEMLSHEDTRHEVVMQLDAQWRESEKAWLSKLEKMVEDWRDLMISDAYINMSQPQRGRVMSDLHTSCVAMSHELQSHRQLSDHAFVQGLNELHRHTAEEEVRAAGYRHKQRFDDLCAHHVAEMQAAEASWEGSLSRLILQWKDYSTSPQFLALPSSQQAEATRQHSNEVARERQRMDDERRAVEAAQRNASAALETEFATEEARTRETVRVREDALTRQIIELAELARQWGAQLDSFVRELDLLISDHATYDELGEFNAQVYSAWALAVSQRTQMLDRHGGELVGLYPHTAAPFPRSPERDTPEANALQKLAFLVSTRQRLAAFIADTFRLAGSSRKAVHQIGEMFTQLPSVRNLAPSVLAPLQRALQQKQPMQHAAGPAVHRMPSSRAGSPFRMEEEGTKWQQLASLETRATSLRRKAVSRSAERSMTPGVEDPMAKQRAAHIVDKLEFTLALLAQLENMLHMCLTQCLTHAECASLGSEIPEPVGFDPREHLEALALPRDQLRELMRLAPVLLQSVVM